MQSDIVIRPATISDAPRICKINRDSLGYDFPPDKTKARLSLVLASANCVLVACCGSEAVGYIHGSSYECVYCDPLKNIVALAVDPAHRHLGIGRMLLSALEDWAQSEGCAGVRLVSGFERQKAHQFYLHCGYMHRKDQKNFIKLF